MNNDISDSVLLDSNIIILYADSGAHSHAVAEDMLRMASLTARKYLISEPTLVEVYGWVKVREQTKAYNTNINSVTHNLRDFLESSYVDVVSVNDIKGNDWHPELTQAFQDIDKLKHGDTPHAVIYHDALLVLMSRSLDIPLLTLDNALQSVVPTRIADMTMPCPFDPSEFRHVDIPTMMDLADPLRAIYRSAFENLKVQAQEIQSIRNQLHDTELVRQSHMQKGVQQEGMLRELREQLEEVIEKEKFWRAASRPDMRRTIGWTLIDTTLGLLGIPVPTSPLAYLLDVVQFNRRMR